MLFTNKQTIKNKRMGLFSQKNADKVEEMKKTQVPAMLILDNIDEEQWSTN